MRCAIWITTGIVLAVAIVGCGGEASTPATYQQLGDTSSAESAAAANDGDDAAEYTVREAADLGTDMTPTAVKTTPSVVHREDRFSEPKSADEPKSEPQKQAQQWTPEAQFRPGTLTAGSIDDHAKYDAYRDYLSKTLQQYPDRSFPNLKIGRRIVIRVANEQGEGIGDARITIRPVAVDEQGENVATGEFATTTASDGRALFLSARDLSADGSDFQLTVQIAGDADAVTQQVSLDQPEWNVVLPEMQQTLPTQLDLALVIDTTGSMKDELDYLKVEIDDIAAAVKRRFPNVEQRFALILFRDEGDEYVTRTFDFTGSLSEFRSKLSKQSAAGGGDYPEAMHLALEQAGQLSWRKTDAARVLFLVGDAPPHARFSERTIAAVETLRNSNVKLFPVAASGVRDEAQWVMRSAAFLTLGRYLFLTDHSGVGNPHAKPQTPSYSVERLNALMVRMIASELAGRELLPNEIIATEANADTIVPQQTQPVIRPQTVYVEPKPIVPTVRPANVGEVFASWCYETIQLPVIRVFAAFLAIALIWKLDTRRRSAAA
ncbi:MAG: VWA domain-containing protein [Planctomycetaceae bacterium]|jgi:hypothetical protein|nr:VWA domain-containing protein [Planctomycetaceae bacterium]MBT6154996.1 VWA domain-containing protein [Planctomycetaceae bacterium]MBT6487329.1 VWA domain-containing protein [Planctomycetaceae bacterium]